MNSIGQSPTSKAAQLLGTDAAGPQTPEKTERLSLTAKALDKFKGLGAAIGGRLSFSAKTTGAGEAKLPVSVTGGAPTTHAARAEGGYDTVEVKERSQSTPVPRHVGKLSERERDQVKNQVTRYDDLIDVGISALGGSRPGKSATPDWKALDGTTTQAFGKDVPKPIGDAVKEIEKKLEGQGFIKDKNGFRHEATGTRIAILYHEAGPEPGSKPEVSLFFQGLGSPKTPGFGARVKQIASEMLGGVPQCAEQCRDIGLALKTLHEANKDSIKFSVVGHSHGGGLAQTAAFSAGIESHSFNSRYPSKAIRNMIGQEKCNNNNGDKFVYNKTGDWLTGNRLVNRLAGAVGATTFIGTVYELPSKGKNIHDDTRWVELKTTTTTTGHADRSMMDPNEALRRATQSHIRM